MLSADLTNTLLIIRTTLRQNEPTLWLSGELHPSEERLAASGLNPVVEAHLNACAACRAKSEILRDLIHTLGAAR